MYDTLNQTKRHYILSDAGTDIVCSPQTHRSLMQLLQLTERAFFFMPGLAGTHIPEAYLALQSLIDTYHETRRRTDRYAEAQQDELEADIRHHLNQLGARHQRSALFGYERKNLIIVFAAIHITLCTLRADIP